MISEQHSRDSFLHDLPKEMFLHVIILRSKYFR